MADVNLSYTAPQIDSRLGLLPDNPTETPPVDSDKFIMWNGSMFYVSNRPSNHYVNLSSIDSTLRSVTGNLLGVSPTLLFDGSSNVSINPGVSTVAGNGRNVDINAGAKNGAGTDGTLSLGTSTTGSVKVGSTASKVGFYGITPVSKPSALTAPNTSNVDSTYGQDEANVIINLRTRLNELETKLKSLGLLS